MQITVAIICKYVLNMLLYNINSNYYNYIVFSREK